jgi:cysteinyl-tRNA synthetase
MSKSLGNSLVVPEVLKRVRGIELRYYMVSAHYRSHVEFSFEALEEAAVGFRRIEAFLGRAADVLGEEPSSGGVACAEFVAAMDDDLGTPAAVAAIHETVREGNRLLAAGASDALRGNAAAVRAMLDVLGLDPADPAWAGQGGGSDERLTTAVDVLVTGLLEQRTQARADKDWATADAIRDRIKAAGIEIEDTPDGPKWSIETGGR